MLPNSPPQPLPQPTGKARTNKATSASPYPVFWGPCPSLLKRILGVDNSEANTFYLEALRKGREGQQRQGEQCISRGSEMQATHELGQNMHLTGAIFLLITF